MDSQDLLKKAESLRAANLPRAIRGFDEDATRNLLESAAQALKTVAHEHDAAQRELEDLRAAALESSVSKEAIGNALLAASRAGEEVVADAAGEAARILERAKAEAAAREAEAAAHEAEHAAARGRLEQETAAARAALEQETAAARAELEHERERLRQDREGWQTTVDDELKRMREEARVEAERMVADARREVERIEQQALELRAALEETQRRFAEIARSALERLEGLDVVPGDGEQSTLLADLHPQTSDEVAEEQVPVPSGTTDGEHAGGTAD